MANRHDDEHLAYGEYHGQGGEESERGFLGDVSKRFGFGRSSRPERPTSSQGLTQQYQPQLYNQPPPQQQLYGEYDNRPSQPSGGGMSGLFGKLQEGLNTVTSEIKNRTSGAGEVHSHTHPSGECVDHGHTDHRYLSFARKHPGNDVKWYVDACGYMWAVSRALEEARESIWILDWWLSPELYLRRPPAKFEQFRVDRMLKAAAERGVKVNIIVYKEVTQALTLSSAHTKHHLEDLHPNICVFRHPDHLPDTQTVTTSFMQSFQNISLNAASASKLPGDALKAIYGVNQGTVLYWAHHEKLCLIDGHIAFMGGLDLCYGRWDTNQHSIADAHPGDLDRIVFPGQDYNNARIMDFQDVPHWENNKLDRSKSSRMGWSDVALCLVGPCVRDLQDHFVQRWNFIYNEKYFSREDKRYSLLQLPGGAPGGPASRLREALDLQQQERGIEGEEVGERGFYDDGEEGGEGERRLFGRGGGGGGRKGGFREKLQERVGQGLSEAQRRYEQRHGAHQGGQMAEGRQGGATCQICRSCTKWSHGVGVEHSIANAYIQVIRESKHFVYIENQFFITATCDEQKPIKNKIGAAMVERILRAARNGEQYKMIIMIPAVPAFAGDLKADDALGTRAIMEFQYNSINRGHGHSIYETIAREGVNPTDYIRFYNLRNYDRINASGVMKEVEQTTGISYDDAQKQHDIQYGGKYNEPTSEYGQPPQQPGDGQQGYGGDGSGYSQPAEMDAPYQGGQTNRGQDYDPAAYGQRTDAYNQYQQGAHQVGDRKGLGSGRWDSVAECYMLGGEDIRNVPWEGGAMDEIDAFVSEELYIHSKLLIADDRVVICGSANLNDRSQLGDHDSEIAIVIEDPTPVQSRMAGEPWQATKFAASLRRQIFRKHLGLIRPQDPSKPNENYEPVGVPQFYNWGSPEDQLVEDPLSQEFQNYWNGTARTNTEVFSKVFHPVPDDSVRNWKQYDEFYERFFAEKEIEKEGKKVKLSKYKWGHVVQENFPGGVQEVKEELAKVKGTLVEMPLLFLKEEDIAKEGLGLNAFTEEVYT